MAFGECAIHERFVNVIFEFVSSLTFGGLPHSPPFFLMTLLTDLSYLSEEGKKCQIRG